MARSQFLKNCNPILARRRFADRSRDRSRFGIAFAGKEIQLTRVRRGGLLGGGKGKLEAEAVGQPLTGLRREPFEMVIHEAPDAPDFAQVPLEFEGPALQRRLAFPEQFPVAMDVLSVAIVFGAVIAQQPQIKEISRGRKELERRQIAFVERTGVGPDPADPMLFQEPNVVRAMPAGVAEFEGETKIARQFG